MRRSRLLGGLLLLVGGLFSFRFTPVVTVQPHAIALSGSSARATLQGHVREPLTGPVAGATWTWTVRNTSVLDDISSTKSAVTLVPDDNGSTYVVGDVGGAKDSALITVTGISPPVPVGKFVATTGSGSSCTVGSPCSLTFACGDPGVIANGDTVWIRAGTYTGTFNCTTAGSAAAPIIFRSYPSELVKVNGRLQSTGANIRFWGIEFYQSAQTASICVDLFGDSTYLINSVVHDCEHTGIGFWHDIAGGELYGNISYNNGTADNLDHGIYFNNTDTPLKRLIENVVFNNWAYGFHAYSSTAGELVNIRLVRNVGFGGTGIGAFVSADVLIGGNTVVNLQVDSMRTYKYDGFTSADLGYVGFGGTNTDVHMRNGLFVGTPGLQLNHWSTIDTSGITKYAFSSKPSSGTNVDVWPNKYEAGRGFVVIYNWASASSVSVDLSTILANGQAYKIYSVQQLGTPIATGTYGGGSVSIPMSASVTPPTPIGRSFTRTPDPTEPIFDVFLVRTDGL